MSDTIELILRLLAACICGGVIGLERMKRLKEAGLRTHVIVCCASALMMIVSKYGFADITPGTLGTDGADPARIAAQVITGVSFLGAGVIFHHANAVKGLTTAAGLWATAGIGLALGAGMYIVGITATVMITLAQAVLYNVPILKEKLYTVDLSITVQNDEKVRARIDSIIDTMDAEVDESSLSITESGLTMYKMSLRVSRKISIKDINDMFDGDSDIKAISFTSVK